ncbi:26S proteasome non-ATPase regulatory subunit 12 [Halotydeus destructor]|nr:26S proteasome non-ATPase regulatory subunit 12 [Halotydeus destructor]
MAEEIFNENGRIVKMEVDYSTTVDEKLPVCEKLAKEGKLNEALDILLALEKQARTGSDTHSTGRILVEIAKLCFEAKDWTALNENILLLTKRRSQIKQAVTKMIQECCTYVDKIPDKTTMLAFIDTLRNVTAGKIYVEVERARLTNILAKHKEAEGNIEEASKIMQELQVETYGSMDRKEKVELILEQMRLCLLTQDFVRTQIISKKIHTKFFDDEKFQDLKLKYYELMITSDQHDDAYLKICKHFRAVFASKVIQENPVEKLRVLRNIVLYIILAPHDNEQSDLIHRIKAEKSLEDLPQYKELLNMFTNAELISWSHLCKSYETLLRTGTADSPATGSLAHDEVGEKRWKHLKNRVVEHNIRIMAKYYSRISFKRMSQLLDLTLEETEEVLSSLVVNKTVWAKVDRLDGVVNFTAYKDPNEVLNDWSGNINQLMQQISQINHLINKEEMVHQYLNVGNETATS